MLRSDFFAMHLEQSGDHISGVGCLGSYVFPGVSQTIPVDGDYPHVRFNYARAFDGKYEKDRNQIAGDWGTGLEHVPLRFDRTNTAMCTNTAAK